MSYTDWAIFDRDYQACLTKYLTPQKRGNDVGVATAWEVYTDTVNRVVTTHPDGDPMLPFQIFGRWVFEQEAERSWAIKALTEADLTLPPGWQGIGAKELANLKPFKVPPCNWNVPVNDCWLLGGVNSKQEFYAASPITWDNILCKKGHIVTVTGRELLGLALAGYVEVETKLGKGYVPGDDAKAEGLNLITYDAEVSKLTNHADVTYFLASKTKFNVG